MRYYDKVFYWQNRCIQKSDSLQSKAICMTKVSHKNSKEKPLKSIKAFFSKNFKEGTLTEQQVV